MNKLRYWFLAGRPWSLTLTILSIATGTSLAARDGFFNGPFLLLTLLAGIAVHMAANMMNDYFDVKFKVDFDKTSVAKYRPHPLLEGKLAPRSVFLASVGLLALAAIIGLWLVSRSGLTLLWIGITGIFLAVFYTAPPFKYKYAALGEIGVFLTWGPLITGGSYFIQTKEINWSVLSVAIPIGLLVVLVVLINNIRDREDDQSSGIKTVPVVFSRTFGLGLYTANIVVSYIWIIVISLAGPLSCWSLLVCLSLPLAVSLIRSMFRSVTNTADAETARFNSIFGLLLVISILLEVFIG